MLLCRMHLKFVGVPYSVHDVTICKSNRYNIRQVRLQFLPYAPHTLRKYRICKNFFSLWAVYVKKANFYKLTNTSFNPEKNQN